MLPQKPKPKGSGSPFENPNWIPLSVHYKRIFCIHLNWGNIAGSEPHIEAVKIFKCEKAFDCWPTIFFLFYSIVPPLLHSALANELKLLSISSTRTFLYYFQLMASGMKQNSPSLKWEMLLESSIENARGVAQQWERRWSNFKDGRVPGKRHGKNIF